MEAKDKEQYVHAVFERIAPTYDHMNDVLSARFHKKWRAQTMRWMQVQPGQSAIDLCCGTCDWTIALADATQTGSVMGVDFSAQMLAYGHQKVQHSHGADRIRLVEANVEQLPLPDDAVDIATIGFGLRNVGDLDGVLREMYRVLKPGGQAVCLEMSRPRTWWARWGAQVYLNGMMPLVAQFFVRRYREYRWLPESVASFPGPLELCQRFERAGFVRVRWHPLTFGVAAVHMGVKP